MWKPVQTEEVNPEAEGEGPLYPIPILQPDVQGQLATAEERLFDKLLPLALKTQAKWMPRGTRRGRFKALLHKIISARQRLRCLRSVLNTLLGPRERDVTSQLNAIAATKKLRREQVKRFFMNYRPAQVSSQLPVGQVMEDMAYKHCKPLLETQCRFWPAAETAAGNRANDELRSSAALPEPGERQRSGRSWIGRGARERKTQRWQMADKLRSGKTSREGHWDVRSASGLQHFQPSSSSRSVKNSTIRKVELGGMGSKSTSLPSLHSKYGGLGKSLVEVDEDVEDFPFEATAESRVGPAMATTFTEVWKPAPPAQKSAGPTSRYMTACERGGILPTPLDFITGGSSTLDAANWALADCDIIPVATMFRSVPEVKEVDLSQNTLLTDKSLVPLLQKMKRNPACATLTRLSLRQCVRLREKAIQEIINLVESSSGLSNLKILDVSGIPFPVRLQLDFCLALGEHSNLENLHLADVGLGSNPVAKQCLEALFRCNTLLALDLSWNAFGDEVFGAIGAYVSQPHVHLRSLSLSNCSSAGTEGTDQDRQSEQAKPFKPVNLMLECLSKAKSLTYLDISINRLDLTGALILEDALSRHRSLTELDVSRNPFGSLGAHSLMRMYAVSQLERLHCIESFDVGNARGEAFQVSNPEGVYALNLSLPYHRSILRMLLKYCKRLSLSPKQAFTDCSSNLPSFSEDEDGIFQVPSSGRMSFTFSSTRSLGPEMYQEPDRIPQALTERLEMTKIPLRMDKAVLMVPIFESLQDKLPLIDALAQNFLLDYSHIELLCNLGKAMMVQTILLRLLHTTYSCQLGRYMCNLLASTKAQYYQVRQRAMLSLTLTPSNPSMHYSLLMGEACDFFIVEGLRVLDRWETNTAARLGYMDISQRGNQSQVRNELFEGRRPSCRSICDWKLPLYGKLEFDFVGGPRPPAGVEPMQEDLFQKFFQDLMHSRCGPWQQLQALRTLAPYFYLTSSQLRELLGAIWDSEARIQLFHIFYYRLEDIWNVKVCRARFSSAEFDVLMERLGPTKFFPYIQPEQAMIELDFSVHDHKLALTVLMALYQKEGAFLAEPRYIREDGTQDELVTGVPRAWARYSDLPRAGNFRAKYLVAPEKRNLKTRMEFLSTVGRWKTPALKQEDVEWWSILSDVSLDIIRFIELLDAKYVGDLKQAFRDIDGDGSGNGGISLHEFEEYCDRLEDSRFAKNRRERFRAIFRHLDATQEGNVSLQEWAYLETVKAELDRQTNELYSFILWHFGGLEKAWKTWEKNLDGVLSQDEWSEGLEQAGYFGACAELFSIIDQKGDGVITHAEFSRIRTGHAAEAFGRLSAVKLSEFPLIKGR